MHTGAFPRSVLLLGASAGALLAASAASAQPAAPEVSEVVVTGERLRLRATIRQKDAVDAVYESVNIDEVGRLPDFNVPDAFRRVPGVSAIFDEDEGRFVTARGLPPALNYITFDGAGVATIGGFGDGSRQVNLEAIPSTAVKRLEVFKTYTPDQDLGWIGGYFNLETRSAFDRPGPQAVINLEANYYTFKDVPNDVELGRDKRSPWGTRVQFGLSNTFGADGQFGAFLSGTYSLKRRDEQKVIQDSYLFFDPVTRAVQTADQAKPDSISVIAIDRMYVYVNLQERYGLDGKLEWKPTGATHLALNGFVYAQQENENRWGHWIAGITAPNVTIASPDAGSFRNAYGELNYTFVPLDRRYGGLNLKGTHELDNGGVFTGLAAWTFAEYADGPFPEMAVRTAANLSGAYERRGLYTFATLDPTSQARWYDDAAYTNVVTNRLATRNSLESVYTFKLDYEFNTDGEGLGYKMGAERRELRRKRDNTRVIFATGTATGLKPGSTFLTDYRIPSRPNYPALFIDYEKWAKNANFTVNPTTSFNESQVDDFTYWEDVTAAYAMLTYDTERFKVIGGLRAETTDFRTRNLTQLTAAQLPLVADPALDVGAALSIPGSAVFVPTRRSGDYSYVKPAISAIWRIRPDLRMKAAFSQTIGRPNPDQLAQTEAITFDTAGDPTTARRGNPNLKPRQADNWDLSLEWYFDEGDGLFSLAAFYKKITDDIVTRTTVETFEGVPVRVTQPVNAERAEVKGVEAQLIKDRFDFLPAPFDGLGFSGNITWTDGETVLDSATGARADFLQFQSEWLGNAALFYNWRDKAEVRVAYAYQGEYDETLTTTPGERVGWEPFGSWDVAVRYNLTDALRLSFDARNIFDKNRVHKRGPDLGLLHEDVEFGKSFFVGVTYKY